ncbi:MAG: hypothetical protein VX269_07750 [Verrucomicrobiota bacterium]|nr:hypothetical protein [Verrucomicrobiota bacterium]
MNPALISFGLYVLAVFALAWIAGKSSSKSKSFVSEYFLGGRALGLWAFALTFATTNASGGSFIGFPAKIYTHGWVLALWIAGYMTVPFIAIGVLGKRLNYVARKVNAITLPEVLGKRFKSESVTLVATSIIVLFMFFYLMAQFKAGGMILSTLLSEEPLFINGTKFIAQFTPAGLDPEYLLTLIIFSLAVIGYVVYGGFKAVVWTDMMQGIIMFLGVGIMLVLVLWQVGGLERATRELHQMVPPKVCEAVFERTPEIPRGKILIKKGTWYKTNNDTIFIVPSKSTIIKEGTNESSSVNAYLYENSRPKNLSETASAKIKSQKGYAYGENKKGVYLTAPGPDLKKGTGFLAIVTALSFFIFWPFGGTGQPANMVRLMAFKNTQTLRRSIITVAFFYSFIYFCLVVIFCCGKVLMPGMEANADRVMPELAALLSKNAGMPWLAGLLVAAPFAAIMSSVDSFILMLSSSLVRDVYQRINPNASQKKLKSLSYMITLGVGILAVFAMMNPPQYLQDLIIFASGGLAGCLLMPMALCLYWPRMTPKGAIAGMLGALIIHLGLTIIGFKMTGNFEPYDLLDLNPFIWDVIGSAILIVSVSLLDKNPPQESTDPFFVD